MAGREAEQAADFLMAVEPAVRGGEQGPAGVVALVVLDPVMCRVQPPEQPPRAGEQVEEPDCLAC